MTDAAPAATFPRRVTKGARKPRDADAPAHYRLSKTTWALILAEYREGATAPELALKWRVSEHALRKRISVHGATKREWGDRQAIAQAQAREDEIQAARTQTPEARAARLFDPIDGDATELANPIALAQTATLASGRAMRERLWSEAKALAGLAESYSRLAERGERCGGGTIETIDLNLLCDIVEDANGIVVKRFQRHFDGRVDPEQAAKNRYWDGVVHRHNAVHHNLKELMFRAVYAEREVHRLGGERRVNRTDVEIEEWVRSWLSEDLTEANLHHRTKLGEWPWR